MRIIQQLLLISSASAWSGVSYTNNKNNVLQQQQQQDQLATTTTTTTTQSRRNFFGVVATTIAVTGFTLVPSSVNAATKPVTTELSGPTFKKSDPPGTVVNLPNGVSYVVLKQGKGPSPAIGELCAIRFVAYAGDMKIDDITDTPEPYYTRVGSGGLIKGVESTIPLMQLGDRWKMTIPGDLAFGAKGRPSSAGRPRIPANAIVTFEVEMVGLPGKEPELIELIGDF